MFRRITVGGAVFGVVVLGLAGPVSAVQRSAAPAPDLAATTPSASVTATASPPHGEIPRDEPTLSPWRVAQGGTVRITSYCADRVGITAESRVFGTVTLTEVTKDGRGRFTTVRVPRDTTPGRYTVHVRCPVPDGGELANLEVYASRKPVGGAATGGGGMGTSVHA